MFLLDRDLGGTISIFLERGILPGVSLMAIAEIVDESPPQHALAFAVDENNALALLVGILGQHLAELVELIVQDV